MRAPVVVALLLGFSAAAGVVGLSPDRRLEVVGVVEVAQDWLVAATSGPLPPAADRDYPQPGFEEEDSRLRPAATAPASTPASAYRFSDTQATAAGPESPVAWSPCRPIHYVINPAGAPADFPGVVAEVVAEVSAATGLTFVDDGATDELPDRRRAAFQHERYGDRWAPVLIGFADAGTVPDLVGAIAGIGGASSYTVRATGTRHLVTGFVYLDVEVLGSRSDGREPAYVPVLRHEVGHLVGLGHTDDPTQLMYPTDQGFGAFRPGDLTGLAALGRGPCVPDL